MVVAVDVAWPMVTVMLGPGIAPGWFSGGVFDLFSTAESMPALTAVSTIMVLLTAVVRLSAPSALRVAAPTVSVAVGLLRA